MTGFTCFLTFSSTEFVKRVTVNCYIVYRLLLDASLGYRVPQCELVGRVRPTFMVGCPCARIGLIGDLSGLSLT